MRTQIIVGTIVLLFSAFPSLADPFADVVSRLNALEKRNDDLAKENASLKQRMSRLEEASSSGAISARHQPDVATSPSSIVTTSAVVPTSARYETASIDHAAEPEPRFSWTGAYVGVHGGGAGGDLAFSETVPPVGALSDNLDASGGLGGIQLGGNKQFGNWVVGAELSMSGAHISGEKETDCYSENVLGLEAECKARVNWLVTGLARLGYAYDRWLLSGAAGWSVAGAEYDFAFDLGLPVATGSSETLSGFTYGAGITYALTQSVSMGVEYLHVDLAADGHAFLGSLAGAGRGDRDLDLNIGRAQLNVKLGE